MSGSDVKPWDQFCTFVAESTRMFKAFSMALDAKKLLFAFLGVVLWGIGTMLINILAAQAAWVIPVAGGTVALAFVIIFFARSEADMVSKKAVITLVLSILAIIAVVAILIYAGADKLGGPSLLMNIYKIAWTLAVAAFFGTAVCRIAAVDAATEDSISPREAARFALKKLSTSIWTLLTPVIAVFAFGVVMMLVGFTGRIPLYIGDVFYFLTGLLYIVALLAGLFFAVLLIVYAPGLTLFQPAIAAEGTDSFDAMSRAYNFILNKPWRLAFYGILGFIYARIVLTVVALVFVGAGRITNMFLAKGVGAKMASAGQLDLQQTIFGAGPSYLSGPLSRAGGHIMGGNVYESFKAGGHPGGWLIVFWQHILLAIFLAFAISFIYSLFTQIYLLMRKACDGTPFDEVYVETPEEEEYEAAFETDEAAEKTEEKTPQEEKQPPKPKKAKKKNETEEPIDLSGDAEDTGQ